MLTDPIQINEYLTKELIPNQSSGVLSEFAIDPATGIVNLLTTAGFQYKGPLKVQFGHCKGHFSVNNTPPSADDPELSFKGFPHTITGCLSLYGSNFNTLSGIEREVRFVGEDIVVNQGSTHILGLLTIGGAGKFDIDRGPIDKIMNKYKESQDTLAAQDELIDAGFLEQACF
jgi:hypothetical protein